MKLISRSDLTSDINKHQRTSTGAQSETKIKRNNLIISQISALKVEIPREIA